MKMNRLITKLEKNVNNDWKFAIKNALLIASTPIIAIGLSIILSIPLWIINNIIDFIELEYVIRGFYYLIGLFVFAMILLKVILNFIDYYKEKYSG